MVGGGDLICLADLRYIQKHQKRIWFKRTFFGLMVGPRRGSLIIALVEYVTCFIFIYLDFCCKKSVLHVLAPDAEHSMFIHFFEFWSMVDRTVVLIVNTIMVGGIISHQGVLMWPFLAWTPFQAIFNVAGTILLATSINRKCLYLFLLVCIDVYGWGVVFSCRKHMYVESIVSARYNGLVIRDAYRQLKNKQAKRYRKVMERTFGKNALLPPKMEDHAV